MCGLAEVFLAISPELIPINVFTSSRGDLQQDSNVLFLTRDPVHLFIKLREFSIWPMFAYFYNPYQCWTSSPFPHWILHFLNRYLEELRIRWLSVFVHCSQIASLRVQYFFPETPRISYKKPYMPNNLLTHTTEILSKLSAIFVDYSQRGIVSPSSIRGRWKLDDVLTLLLFL